MDLPLGDYCEFLARYDGTEGFIGPDQYLILWKASDLPRLNKAYKGEARAGPRAHWNNGGGTAFAIETRAHRYVAMPNHVPGSC